MSLAGKLFPYCQNESLLLQFILQEWLISYSTLQIIQNSYSQLEPFEVENLLVKLFSPFSHHRSCFDLNEGSLIVLHHYTTLFLFHFDKHKNFMTATSTAIHRALKEIVTLQEVLFKIKNFPLKNDRKKLIASINKLCDCLFKASHYLSKIVVKYLKDENLLLFIHNHHEQLEPFFKEGCKNFLDKHFQNGLEEMKEYMISRFAKRGFTNIPELSKRKREDQHQFLI